MAGSSLGVKSQGMYVLHESASFDGWASEVHRRQCLPNCPPEDNAIVG